MIKNNKYHFFFLNVHKCVNSFYHIANLAFNLIYQYTNYNYLNTWSNITQVATCEKPKESVSSGGCQCIQKFIKAYNKW